MRIIESFTNWKNIIHVNEDLASAKTYMINRYKNKQADGSSNRLNTNDTAELTPDEKDAALLDPNYLKILKLAEPFPSLTLAFIKFHFDQNIPIKSGVLNLTNLANQLSDPATNAIIKALPKQIIQYANQETGDQLGHGSGFEELTDQINKGIRSKAVYAEILDKIPNPLRSLIKSQPEDSLVKIINLMTELSSINKKIGEFIETDKDSPLFGKPTTVLRNFFLFVSAFKNKPVKDFYEKITAMVKGLSSNKAEKIAKATRLEPQVKILYDKDNYLAFSVRTEEAQKELCSEANWCLNTGSFKSYVANAVQLNIINYNEPIATAKYITGTTIKFDSGEVTSSSDYNNFNIKNSSNLETHLLNNGYPDKLVKSIVSQMPSEILIKYALYSIGDSSVGLLTFIEKMITSTYRPPLTKTTVIGKLNLDEIIKIIQPQITEHLDERKLVDLYKRYGLLSLDSANLFKLLVPNISEEDKNEIYIVTAGNYSRIHKSAKLNISVLMPQLTKILDEEAGVRIGMQIPKELVEYLIARIAKITWKTNNLKDQLEELDAEQRKIQWLINGLAENSVEPYTKRLNSEADIVSKKLANSSGSVGSNNPVNEMVMAEPKEAPTKTPTETPTKPKINPRPSPIPSKQPFKTPEPAKADAGDVIKRLNNLI
jgi:hypothetical protein